MNPWNKKLDHNLDRLLRSAALAPARALPELDFGLQQRVLLALRAAPARVVEALTPRLWWRGALAACSLATAVVVLATVNTPAESQDPYASPDAGVALIAPSFAGN